MYYFGENITTASDSVNVSMATIDLPAVDSDVNIVVTAVNVFGSGPNSTIFINKICELIIRMYYIITIIFIYL